MRFQSGIVHRATFDERQPTAPDCHRREFNFLAKELLFQWSRCRRNGERRAHLSRSDLSRRRARQRDPIASPRAGDSAKVKNMARKIRVGILFGGRSAEHEVSLQSAKNIIDAIDTNKYEVVLIGIDKKGQWHLNEESRFIRPTTQSELPELPVSGENLALVPGKQSEQLVALSGQQRLGSLDVIFPVLHGPFGEDGTVQGLLKLANIAFVGAGVLGSAVGMDKDVMKRLLRDAGIPIARFIVASRYSSKEIGFDYARGQLGLPLFIKPANLGSSVGIQKVKDGEEFESAVRDAFNYDNKILIEESIDVREMECSVLGNDNPISSVPGEILPRHEFYSYEAKYLDENGAVLEIPAN